MRFFVLALALPLMAQQYDVVLNNGRVIDPDSKLDAIRSVGVKNGKIAAISAQRTVDIVTTFVSTKPLPIVDATAPPMSAPVRLKNAAMAIACRGVSTLVETTVAIAFAAS